MIEEIAVITRSDGPFAQVETQRNTSCGNCAAKSTCGTSAISKIFGRKVNVIKVLNPINAVVGERVIVGLDESALTKASLLVYIAPLVSLFLFALAGEWLAEKFNLTTTEPAAVMGGLLGLLAGLAWLRYFAVRISQNREYQAVILRRAKLSEVTLDIDQQTAE